MNKEILMVVDAVSNEKGVDKEIIFEALEAGEQVRGARGACLRWSAFIKGGHFREEHQYPDGECKRDDEKFGHVAAWEFQGEGQAPLRNVEAELVELVQPLMFLNHRGL